MGTLQSFQAGLPSGLARLSNPHHPHLISLALLVLQVAVGFSPAYLNSNSHHWFSHVPIQWPPKFVDIRVLLRPHGNFQFFSHSNKELGQAWGLWLLLLTWWHQVLHLWACCLQSGLQVTCTPTFSKIPRSILCCCWYLSSQDIGIGGEYLPLLLPTLFSPWCASLAVQPALEPFWDLG